MFLSIQKIIILFDSKQERHSRQLNCDADQFQCKAGDCKYSDNDNCNGPCIRSSWVNDGEADCTDGSDESELPVNCQWSNWSASGSCSKTCDGGRQKYNRYKTVIEKNGGFCSGLSEHYTDCNTKSCLGDPCELAITNFKNMIYFHIS